MTGTTAPPTTPADDVADRIRAFLDAQDRHVHGRMPVATTHAADGTTLDLERDDLRGLLANLSVARAGYLAMEQHAHTVEAKCDRLARELQKGALDVTGAMREIAGLRAELDAVAAERDELRRRLDTAKAAPCRHSDTPAPAARFRIHTDRGGTNELRCHADHDQPNSSYLVAIWDGTMPLPKILEPAAAHEREHHPAAAPAPDRED